MQLIINDKTDFNKITPKITELYFTENFNDNIDNLPNHIKKIEFDYCSKFNYLIDFLPESLEELILPRYKNHTLTELRTFIPSSPELPVTKAYK